MSVYPKYVIVTVNTWFSEGTCHLANLAFKFNCFEFFSAAPILCITTPTQYNTMRLFKMYDN